MATYILQNIKNSISYKITQLFKPVVQLAQVFFSYKFPSKYNQYFRNLYWFCQHSVMILAGDKNIWSRPGVELHSEGPRLP